MHERVSAGSSYARRAAMVARKVDRSVSRGGGGAGGVLSLPGLHYRGLPRLTGELGLPTQYPRGARSGNATSMRPVPAEGSATTHQGDDRARAAQQNCANAGALLGDGHARSGAGHQGRQRQNSLPRGRPGRPSSDHLADVCLPRPKGDQTAELGRLIAVDGFDVQVQPVLGKLRPVRYKPEVNLERDHRQRRSIHRSYRDPRFASPAPQPRTGQATPHPSRQ